MKKTPKNSVREKENVVYISSTEGLGAVLAPGSFADINVYDAIPGSWEEKAAQAWHYYKYEPIVNNIINTWRTFALGDSVRFVCDNVDLTAEVRKFAERVNLNTLLKDSIINLLVTGDAICWKGYNSDGTDFDEIVCVNPISVQVRYEGRKLAEATQFKNAAYKEDSIPLPLSRVLHLRWNVTSDSPRGNSMVLSAFHDIELLHDYRKVQEAIAKGWKTPLRLVQVGGVFGDKVIMPDDHMLRAVRDMLNRVELKNGTVIPPYIKVSTFGARGDIGNIEEKIREVRSNVMVALGISQSLVTGVSANFTNTTLAWRKTVIMLKEIRQMAREILNWVFSDWLSMKAREDNSIHYIFDDFGLTNDIDIKKLELALLDRKIISRETFMQKMGLDPDMENAMIKKEAEEDLHFDNADVLLMLYENGIISAEAVRRRVGLNEKAGTTIKTKEE
ncbi:MAG: hypothetical protein WCS96_06290 [Victivallales bacterium]